MNPVARTLVSVCMLAALVVAGALTGRAQAQPPVMIVQARFVDPPLAPVSDGRLHLSVAINLHSIGLIPSIDSVQWSNGGVDVRISARRPSGGVLTAHTVETLPLTIDNLRPGSYAVRLWSHTFLDQFQVVVPTMRSVRFPLELRVWPPDPTPYEPLWLLVDRWNQCHQVRPDLNGTQWLGALAMLTPACTAPVQSPRLAAALLPPQSAAPERVSIRAPDSLQQLVLRRAPFQVSRRLPARFNGAWFDPAQSGQGVTLEIVDGGTVLLQWLTFDTAGDPFWIVASGPNVGGPVLLEAHTVSGGRFPPQFDPALVQRQAWGTIRLDILSCARVRMRWDGRMPRFVSGAMDLERLDGTHGGGCGQPPPDAVLEPAWYQGPGSYFRLPDPG